MRLPDLSMDLPTPGPALDAQERGQLLLRYIAAGQPVRGLDFSKAALRGADLRGAELAGSVLVDANLYGADLRGTCLSGTDLERANLEQVHAVEADLRNARLVGTQLGSARLGGADLRFADMQRARLPYAVLSQARLEGADLRGANLQRARLRQANLSGTDLRGADLRWADLLLAELTGAHIDLRGTQQSGWTPTELAALQQRGLVISSLAPLRAPLEPPVGPARPELRLRVTPGPSPLEAALMGVVVALWREAGAGERTAALDTSHPSLVMTAETPEELERLARWLEEGRWEDLARADTLQAAAVARLAALLARREGLELWVHPGDGGRKVLPG